MSTGFPVTVSWLAKEAARIWANENPAGCWFPAPFTISVPGNGTTACHSKSLGRAPGYQLELPVDVLGLTLNEATRLLHARVIQALGTDYVKDGRHLMNSVARLQQTDPVPHTEQVST